MSQDGMKMKTKHNNKGFSIAELLVGMAIFVLVLALVNAFMSTGLSTYKYTMSQENSIAKGRTAFNKLVDEIRYSKKVIVPNDSTNVVLPESPDSPLKFEDNSGEVTVTIDSTSKSLKFSDGKSYAEGVATSLKVTKESNNQFTIELTLNDGSYSSSPDVVFKSRVQCFNM